MASRSRCQERRERVGTGRHQDWWQEWKRFGNTVLGRFRNEVCWKYGVQHSIYAKSWTEGGAGILAGMGKGREPLEFSRRCWLFREQRGWYQW